MASNNKYLEKLASMDKEALSATKRYAAGIGMNVDGISSGSLVASLNESMDPGSFSRMNTKANQINKRVNPGYKATSKPSLRSRALRMMNGGKPVMSREAANRLQDLKAHGVSVNDAVRAHAKAKAEAEASGTARGILRRARGFVKKNPMISAGLALGGGLLAGKAMSGNSQDSAQYY